MNTGFFTGNLGRDAELRQASNGDAVANFPLAVETGTRQTPQTMWIDCSIWGKRAEKLAQYLTKGKKVAILGRVSQDIYTKRDGTQGFRIQVSCNEVEFLSVNREDPVMDQVEQLTAPAPRAKQASKQQALPAEFEDDIPF
jgi:single-strand DNA-binding protein